MADAVSELLVTEAAIDKLGSRGITIEESHQLPRNVHVTIRNPHHGPSGPRRLLIGRTDGGRSLTLVIEQTSDPTTWLIITGWDATPASVEFWRADHGQGPLDRPQPPTGRLQR